MSTPEGAAAGKARAVTRSRLGRTRRAASALVAWARHAAWMLLGAGFLLLVVNAAAGAAWGPVAVGLLIGGYAMGLIAVLPVVIRTFRAFCEALTAFLPASVALPLAVALLIGATWLAARAWVASPW